MLVGGSLEFTSVRLEDAGKYVCTASNEAGSVSRAINLDVQGNAIPSVQGIQPYLAKHWQWQKIVNWQLPVTNLRWYGTLL